MQSAVLRNVIIATGIVVATAVGILGVKSIVEMILYAQPMVVRVLKNIFAFIADVVVLIASLPVCICMKGTIQKLIAEKP